MCGFSVRTFREGDESGIVEFFNGVYGKCGGFVPRTVEYWRWCCLSRPDVKEEGVFLAFNGERLCGYLVAGISGNIWEYCAQEGEKEAARALLTEAVTYLENMGVSSVNVNALSGGKVVENLVEAGFSEIPAERMFITTLNPAALVRALVSSWKQRNAGLVEVFGFRLHAVPFGVRSEFSVKIQGEAVDVTEGLPPEPSVIVDLGFMDFLSVIFGGSNANRLFLARRIRVKPFRKWRAVSGFLSAIRPVGSWFFPLSDYG